MLEQLNKKPEIRALVTKPFIRNINPNILTWLSLAAAIGAGIVLYYQMLFIGGFLILINGFFDLLDGQVAKTFGKQTKFGDFLDHALDRISDFAILLGITLSGLVPKDIGFYTIIAVLLVSYIGTQAQAITSARLYSAILGRADRIVLLSLGCMIAHFFAGVLYYVILVVLVLSLVTFIQRFIQAGLIIKKSDYK